MAPARGDRRPCTHTDCSGTMRFGREPLPTPLSMKPAEGERGWVCSDTAAHFRPVFERGQPDTATRATARARWEDDGGQQLVDLRRDPSMTGQLGARS